MGRRKKKVVETEEVKEIQSDSQPIKLEAEEIPDIQLEVVRAPDIDILIETTVNKDCVCDEPCVTSDTKSESKSVINTEPVVENEEILSAPIIPKTMVIEALDVFPELVSRREKVENKVKSLIKTSTDMKGANKLQKLRMISARLRSNRVKSLPIRKHNTINAKFSIK